MSRRYRAATVDHRTGNAARLRRTGLENSPRHDAEAVSLVARSQAFGLHVHRGIVAPGVGVDDRRVEALNGIALFVQTHDLVPGFALGDAMTWRTLEPGTHNFSHPCG